MSKELKEKFPFFAKLEELELEEEEYVKYLKYAHENNMSFNELAEKAVKEAMENNDEENGTI